MLHNLLHDLQICTSALKESVTYVSLNCLLIMYVISKIFRCLFISISYIYYRSEDHNCNSFFIILMSRFMEIDLTLLWETLRNHLEAHWRHSDLSMKLLQIMGGIPLAVLLGAIIRKPKKSQQLRNPLVEQKIFKIICHSTA